MKEEKKGGPTVERKRKMSYFLSFTGGEGGSPVCKAGDRGLVSSLTLRDSSGQENRENRVLGGGIFMGGRNEKWIKNNK